MFQHGAWNRALADIVIFDDVFIDENVYSGLVVGSDHRQNLHELILGSQGVALSQQLQAHIASIEQHNKEIRSRGNAIPAIERGASPLMISARSKQIQTLIRRFKRLSRI